MARQSSPTSETQLTAAQKLRGAVELRRGGATLQQIADAGYYSSPQAVHRAIMNYYKKLHGQIAGGVEALRAQDLDRCDAMLRSLWPIATNRDKDRHLYAIDRVIKLLQHRAKLLGLEAPQKHELTGEAGERLMPEGIDLSNLTPEQLEEVRGIMDAALNGSGSTAPN